MSRTRTYGSRTQTSRDIQTDTTDKQDKTLHTDPNTYGHVPVADTDLEAVYFLYPKKVGKSNGFKRLKRELKTKDDLSAFEGAVRRFKTHLENDKTDSKFIPHFSTFVNSWRDWLNPETGTCETKNSGSSDPFSFLKQAGEK